MIIKKKVVKLDYEKPVFSPNHKQDALSSYKDPIFNPFEFMLFEELNRIIVLHISILWSMFS